MKKFFIIPTIAVLVTLVADANSRHNFYQQGYVAHDASCADEHNEEEFNMRSDRAACRAASASQLKEVDHGNQHAAEFLEGCYAKTGNSRWCKEVMRPNPSSINTFRCTYGNNRPHQLVHPSSSTWKNAYQAVQLVEELEDLGICVSLIYNWWRPEPYNANVGGAAGRHPFGTSVDVRFCSMSHMERAFKQLCTWRRQGRLRALGYYGSTGLHLGIGDGTANTWGKSCN